MQRNVKSRKKINRSPNDEKYLQKFTANNLAWDAEKNLKF